MTVSIDRSGGLNPSLDQALVHGPADPLTYETFNVWLVDGPRRIGFNLHLYYVRDGIARERATLFFPDGRRFITHSEGRYENGAEPGGRSLRYRCVKPYENWEYRWNAEAITLTQEQEAQGSVTTGPTAEVVVEVKAQTLTEPWLIPLSTGPQSLVGPPRTADGIFLGKYEQIIRGEGTISAAGESYAFSGVGLRGHVRGPRDTTGMGSHAWVTGQFPGGRGFGLKQLFTLDGTPYFSEAYLAEDGRILRAEIINSPKFSRDSNEHGFSVELQAGNRTARIEGMNFHTTWIPLGDWGGPAPSVQRKAAGTGAFAAGHGLVQEAAKIMSQSCSRFIWDGEEGFGMCELSG